MSTRFRFIDIVRPIMGLLPEVEKPLKKVSYLVTFSSLLTFLIATIQRQAYLDFHYFVHLFDLLPNSTLRYR